MKETFLNFILMSEINRLKAVFKRKIPFLCMWRSCLCILENDLLYFFILTSELFIRDYPKKL